MRSSIAVALAEEAVAHDLIVGAARFTRPLRTDDEVAPYAGYGLGFLRWTQSDGAARAVFADLSARSRQASRAAGDDQCCLARA